MQDFADGLSQGVALGLVLAAIERDSVPTLGNPPPALASPWKRPLRDALRKQLAHLESLAGAIDVAILQRGDAWLYFYEHFLRFYDPHRRRQAGVYYTPVEVVRAMVAMADALLRKRFGLSAGFADATVLTLDPASGTGTFPLAVIDRAAARLGNLAATHLASNLRSFELLPGPCAVARLRLTQRLRQLDPSAKLLPTVTLGDTLASPESTLDTDPPRVTVVIGNPPYRRLRSAKPGTGGWILDGPVPGRVASKSLFDDLLDVAKTHTVFSHHASLYNLYVYFWRWALWRAFEASSPGHGVVALVTASSWLTGPGFLGLRALMRELCDEVWVIDLGGDNKGATHEENVFAIATPVAIALLVRSPRHDPATSAVVRYRRITGTRDEKLAQLRVVAASDDPFAGTWTVCPSGMYDRMSPSCDDPAWNCYPALADLLPWQQPGCKFGRTWPIAPTQEALMQRWDRFVSSPPEARPALFQTGTSGRTVFTEVAASSPLAHEPPTAPPPPIRRYAYRSFDRQWAFDDPRMAKTESPSLWRSASDRQVYLACLMTGRLASGPSLTASACVPDLHCFCGRGGKDVIPLYRDAEAREPNVPAGLLACLGDRLGIREPSPEDLVAYIYAILSAPQYQARFSQELTTPGPRVPLTAQAALWEEAVAMGAELLWLHTYAERFRGPGRDTIVPPVHGLEWERPVTQMPRSSKEIAYDSPTRTLAIGNGRLRGVAPEVWDFTVSRMCVVKKWLRYRTVAGSGKALSSGSALDKIRSEVWPGAWNDELLDLIGVLTHTVSRREVQGKLIDRICKGTLILANELPAPGPLERKAPRLR